LDEGGGQAILLRGLGILGARYMVPDSPVINFIPCLGGGHLKQAIPNEIVPASPAQPPADTK
jgi:hypothetical protein